MANIFSNIYHQVNPIDGGRTADTDRRGVNPGTGSGIAQWAKLPTLNTGSKSSSSAPTALDKEIARLNAELKGYSAQAAALQAQLALQPKLPTFDYSANWAKAQSQAAKTVNPVYQDKLNRYLAKKNLSIKQQRTTTTRNKQDIQTALEQALEDTATGRVRTNEDADTKIGDITATENSWQRQEGRMFDQARAALLGEVANAGLTESGLGQGQVQNAVTDRNLASEDQVREFTNDKRDVETFRTRTLADLDTTDTRERGGAARKTEDQDIALRDFIDTKNLEERDTRADLELERTGAIRSATQSAFDKILANTIQSLASSGARAQDIALFKEIYG
jgi:hypothetical protein